MGNTKVDKAAGLAKETLGKATGNKRLENEGKLEQDGASLREAAGGDSASHRAAGRPPRLRIRRCWRTNLNHKSISAPDSDNIPFPAGFAVGCGQLEKAAKIGISPGVARTAQRDRRCRI